MKFSIKKSLMENFILCAVLIEKSKIIKKLEKPHTYFLPVIYPSKTQ